MILRLPTGLGIGDPLELGAMGAGGGGLIPSAIIFPSQGREEFDNITQAVEDLNRDVQRDIGNAVAAGTAPAEESSFYSSWRAFRAAWQKLYSDQYNATFGWGGAFDTAQDYRKKLADFRTRFTAGFGGTTTGPDIPPPAATPKNLLGMFGLNFPTWTLYAAGGVVALVALGPLLSTYLVTRPRRNPRRRRRR